MSTRDRHGSPPPGDGAPRPAGAAPARSPAETASGQRPDTASLPPDAGAGDVAAASTRGVPEDRITAGFAAVSDPHAGPHGDVEIPPAARSGRLFFGLLGGPVVWAAQLQAGYSLGTMNCGDQHRLVLHLVSLAALLIVAAAAWTAWRAWRALGEVWPEDDGGPPGRARFMAATGTITSVGFCLVIVAQAVPSFVFPICH